MDNSIWNMISDQATPYTVTTMKPLTGISITNSSTASPFLAEMTTPHLSPSAVPSDGSSLFFSEEGDLFNSSLDYTETLDHNTSAPSIVVNTTQLPLDMQFNEGHVLLITCYSTIMVVSLVGNLCVLRAILGGTRKHRKSRVNFMLLHLAIADLIVTVIMIPEEVGWAATVEWLAGDALCRLFSFLRIFGHYLSSFILVCISIDRYFAVVHPLSLNAAARRGKMMLSLAWFLALSCSIPQMIIFHVASHPVHTHYEQCVTFGFFPTIQHEIVYNLFCLTMLYVAPLLIIIVSYGAIVVTIVQKSRLSSDDNVIRRSSLGYLGKAKARTIKMTVSIVAAFFVCWTPYVIISLWFCFNRHEAELIDQRVQKSLFIFACTNSCVNPLVYGIFNFCKNRKPEMHQTWRSSTAHSHVHASSTESRILKSSTKSFVVTARETRSMTSNRFDGLAVHYKPTQEWGSGRGSDKALYERTETVCLPLKGATGVKDSLLLQTSTRGGREIRRTHSGAALELSPAAYSSSWHRDKPPVYRSVRNIAYNGSCLGSGTSNAVVTEQVL